MSVYFITGCSAGIGEAAAVYFAGKGHCVYATMRTPADAGDRCNDREAPVSLRFEQIRGRDQQSDDTRCVQCMLAKCPLDLALAGRLIGQGPLCDEQDIETAELRSGLFDDFWAALGIEEVDLDNFDLDRTACSQVGCDAFQPVAVAAGEHQ